MRVALWLTLMKVNPTMKEKGVVEMESCVMVDVGESGGENTPHSW